ncbi:interferon-related developmental regulator 2-like isoform X1 [Myxocyprinus asiaticus]|uniref:interferon-related developmental regulator 2-like isoform X1 n=1 Tax=Myxocyprinus asiaticus TaxID=70543 RepID=UPI002222779A|nr:interferon-related developmental regulator 2-like isoform X1 [Myxocyprinus asiaticus]
MPRNKKGKRGGTGSSKGSLRQEVLQLQLSKTAQSHPGRNGVKVESGMSDDDLASEVLSHFSSASESASVLEDGTGDVVDEQTAQEETEDKLKQCIDNLMDKSAKTRLAAMESLHLAFSSRVLYDFLLERRFTISDCLERSLRKGGGEEQAAAATLCALLCVQLGVEGEEGFKILCPILNSILIDSCASLSARQSCARALGMCCYVSASDDAEDLIKSLGHLESVFVGAYPLGDGTLPSVKAGTPALHSAALQAWALLCTLCPASRIDSILNHHLPCLHACLESSEVNFRIAVGETIALLYELGRDIDQEYEYEDCDALCDSLKSLATDGNKHRAKNDRRKQRSIFREVLHYIENDDFTEEKIQFGTESIYIDGWMRHRMYNAFKEVLESGVRHHLQFNPLLRDIFGLGPPLILDASVKASRISRTERHLFNSAAFKARTKLRNKVRDKRADVM